MTETQANKVLMVRQRLTQAVMVHCGLTHHGAKNLREEDVQKCDIIHTINYTCNAFALFK